MLAIRVALSNPGEADVRARYFEDHKKYLRSRPLRIVQSGPILDEFGETAGGVVVAEVNSIDEMREFSSRDPFVIHGVYADVRIYEWRPTIKDGGGRYRNALTGDVQGVCILWGGVMSMFGRLSWGKVRDWLAEAGMAHSGYQVDHGEKSGIRPASQPRRLSDQAQRSREIPPALDHSSTREKRDSR